jgi:hypothetical protein
MRCPECDSSIIDAAAHSELCSVDPIRLLNIGLITQKEYENIIEEATKRRK